MPYRVKAVKRHGWPQRRRDGRVFSSSAWTVLQDDELTDAIREDRCLIVEAIEAEPTTTHSEPATLLDGEAPMTASTQSVELDPGSITLEGRELAGVAAEDKRPEDAATPARCAATTKAGNPCSGKATASGFCMAHAPKA